MFETVAVQSPGDMGHAIGAVLRARGFRVISSLAGRSAETRARAERSAIEDAGDLDALVGAADLVLSIMPPAAAFGFARDAAAAMVRAGRSPLFADCNAIAPETSERIQTQVEAAGAAYVDGGLIGAPPAPGRPGTRLYLSGPKAAELEALGGSSDAGTLDVRTVGDEVGRASGLKMVYAGLTKGTMTLQTAVLVTAERLGLLHELAAELQESQGPAWQRMARIPFLPADAGRWIGEMREIAATFRAAGVTSGFHEGAEAMFRLMAGTPFARETRDTLDRSRTLEQAIRVFAEQLEEER